MQTFSAAEYRDYCSSQPTRIVIRTGDRWTINAASWTVYRVDYDGAYFVLTSDVDAKENGDAFTAQYLTVRQMRAYDLAGCFTKDSRS